MFQNKFNTKVKHSYLRLGNKIRKLKTYILKINLEIKNIIDIYCQELL